MGFSSLDRRSPDWPGPRGGARRPASGGAILDEGVKRGAYPSRGLSGAPHLWRRTARTLFWDHRVCGTDRDRTDNLLSSIPEQGSWGPRMPVGDKWRFKAPPGPIPSAFR